jgi:murein L,D-transpeptidase YcbB/YkuD
MHAGREQYVTLKRTIPVYIGYFTAFIGDGGQLNFRSDIYQRDDILLGMLMQQ